MGVTKTKKGRDAMRKNNVTELVQLGIALRAKSKDRRELLTFYDFPAEHWKHIRTANLIESTFATVRHRIKRSKGCLAREISYIMVFKPIKRAEKTWRRLNGKNQLPKVITGVKFRNGMA